MLRKKKQRPNAIAPKEKPEASGIVPARNPQGIRQITQMTLARDLGTNRFLLKGTSHPINDRMASVADISRKTITALKF
jgi:hypothetical protein